jgi:MFS family permease
MTALFNAGINLPGLNITTLLFFRFLTGFFLAGIYPVGMKIAADYYDKSLGKSLGFLVGALVIGTALPHLIKSVTYGFNWKYVVLATSGLCFSGGLLILVWVPDGPYRKPGQKINFTAFGKGFSRKNFRSVAFGYFGHMWELYSFWAFVPVMLSTYTKLYPTSHLNVSLVSFFIIASGAVACVVSGLLSQRYGAKKIATLSLTLSCLCCIMSPLFLQNQSVVLLISFLLVWGVTVIADSPLFSTLVAQNAPEDSKGTALTIVNCIGFSITIISIQLITQLMEKIDQQYIYLLLAIGPLLGLLALRRNKTLLPMTADSAHRN